MCHECSATGGSKLFVERECTTQHQDKPGGIEVSALKALFSSPAFPHTSKGGPNKVENYVMDVFRASYPCLYFSSNSIKNVSIQEKKMGSFTISLVSWLCVYLDQNQPFLLVGQGTKKFLSLLLFLSMQVVG